MEIRNQRHYQKKRLKYGNRSCECRQKHWHDSVKESRYCDQLELLRMAGEIKSYETQVTFPLEVNGQKICSHRVDFLIKTNSDGKEVHEVKGFATREWDLKRKLFEAIYSPEIEYIVIR